MLKTPLLVEHYFIHRKENRDITLGQFLYIHYVAAEVKDADYAKDRELPFKSHDKGVSAISNFYVSLAESFSILPFKQIVEEKTFAIKDGFSRTYFLSSIWQPPKV